MMGSKTQKVGNVILGKICLPKGGLGTAKCTVRGGEKGKKSTLKKREDFQRRVCCKGPEKVQGEKRKKRGTQKREWKFWGKEHPCAQKEKAENTMSHLKKDLLQKKKRKKDV